MADKVVIRTDRAPGPFQGAPYNQAIRVGELVFVAGQLGISLETGELAGPAVGEQTEQVLQNLAAILDAAGSGLDRLVKTTVFLVDLADFADMQRVADKVFLLTPRNVELSAEERARALERGGFFNQA